MSYLVEALDPVSGLTSRIGVPNQLLARHAGMRELDEGRELVAVHATAGEWPVTVEDILTMRASRPKSIKLCGRGTEAPQSPSIGLQLDSETGFYKFDLGALAP